MSPAAGIACEDADLAILDPTRRAGILPPHADRMCALFQEPGFINDEDPTRIFKRVQSIPPDPIAERIRRPR